MLAALGSVLECDLFGAQFSCRLVQTFGDNMLNGRLGLIRVGCFFTAAASDQSCGFVRNQLTICSGSTKKRGAWVAIITVE